VDLRKNGPAVARFSHYDAKSLHPYDDLSWDRSTVRFTALHGCRTYRAFTLGVLGLAWMLLILGERGDWSVGLLPLLLGLATILIGLFRNHVTSKETK
jgi:hypothetical protein